MQSTKEEILEVRRHLITLEHKVAEAAIAWEDCELNIGEDGRLIPNEVKAFENAREKLITCTRELIKFKQERKV